MDMPFRVVGGWTTKKITSEKVWLTITRILALVRFGMLNRFDLALNHMSHPHNVATGVLRKRNVSFVDYERQPANRYSLRFVNRIFVPQCLGYAPFQPLGISPHKFKTYAGMKEDVYLSDFEPNTGFRDRYAEIPWHRKVIVVVRPPATSIYHHFDNPFFDALMAYLAKQENVFLVLLPRFPGQLKQLRALAPEAWSPQQVMDGPQLIYHADLVISAVGTMNRESVVLNTPAYSAFCGAMGAIDQGLIREGKMIHITKENDFANIRFVKKKYDEKYKPRHPEIVNDIVESLIGSKN